jgi:hypothetical protein
MHKGKEFDGMAGSQGVFRASLIGVLACLSLGLCSSLAGCGGDSIAPPHSDAQERLAKLMNLYRTYVEKNQRGPPNEQALREFGQKLSPTERADRKIGDDLEEIFTSPRDKQKFNVKYNIKPEPAVNRALAWEEIGQNGRHWVALTMGYVVEYDGETLKQYTK